MKTTFKSLPGSKIDLEVSLEAQEFNNYWQSAHDQALSEVELKGFRRGAAPKELAEKAIDREKVFEAAAHNAVKFSLDEASKDNDWFLISEPKVEVLEAHPATPGSSAKVGLRYRAELTVFPEIKLGNYQKIAKKVLAEKKEITVEPAESEKNLNWLRESRAKLVLSDKGAENGNLVDADIQSFADDKPIPGGEIRGDRFVLGESRFIKGFDQELLSRKAGENLEFKLLAPEDYWQKDLRGKQVSFKVKINSVFNRALPALDDEFAKGLGPSFQGLDQLKKNITDGLKIEKEGKERERLRLKIIQEIVKESKIDPPQIMIDKTLENLVAEFKAMLRNSNQNYSEEELKKSLEPRARERILADLVMYKIMKDEHLEPTEEEIKLAAEENRLDVDANRDYIYSIVRHKKLFDFLEGADAKNAN